MRAKLARISRRVTWVPARTPATSKNPHAGSSEVDAHARRSPRARARGPSLAFVVLQTAGLLPARDFSLSRRPDVDDRVDDRVDYSFFASTSSAPTSRRLVSPLTVRRGLSFSKVLRPMPLMRMTWAGSENGLLAR